MLIYMQVNVACLLIGCYECFTNDNIRTDLITLICDQYDYARKVFVSNCYNPTLNNISYFVGYLYQQYDYVTT